MFRKSKASKFYTFAFVMFLISCAPSSGDKKNTADSTITKPTEKTTIPGVEKLSFTDTIHLKAGESMRFDNELFRVKTGKKITLIFTNTSAKTPTAMTHNVVVLAQGTDIADFADAVRNAKDEQYTPASVAPLMVAHTRMVGGADSVRIEFTIAQPGVYDYICSFPGHWGTMQGKIVAE
jgi:azurin